MATSRSLLGYFLVFSVAFQAVAALQGEVVVYWGQSSTGSEKALQAYCADSTYDIIVVAFVYDFPSSQGDSAYPALNLAGHCNDVYPGHPNLLTCPDVASDIQYCQSQGKKVFLSLGGAEGSYGFTSTSQAQTFATTVWNTFLGGNGPVRPFGNAIFDGIDLDIESGSSSGYADFITKLRTYFAGASKNYYISGAPQCPYPDEWLGPKSGLALEAGWFDYVWVQFYNNYCGLDAYPSQFNFATWAKWAQSSANPNPNIKILIGAPASSSAAGTGYVNAATLQTISAAVYSQYPNIFGGIMLWDAGTAEKNSNFGSQLAAFLHTGTPSNPPSNPPSSPPKGPSTTGKAKPAAATTGKTKSPHPPPPAPSTTGKTKGSHSSTSASVPVPVPIPPTPAGSSSSACVSGHMICASSETYQTCTNGVWAQAQSCQRGLTCTPVGTYIYCE